MHVSNKKEKLIKFAESVLNSDLYRDELSALMNTFSLTKDKVIEAFLDYNMDIFSHGNEIYDSHAIRVVLHIHNLLENSWHIERQSKANKLINLISPHKIIDLGFGVPSLYVKNVLAQGKQLTLCDMYEAPLDFAKHLIQIWNPEMVSHVSFLHSNLANVAKCVGNYDLYILLNSIEHVEDPTSCMSEYVQLSSPDASFLLEIPIGPITPEHYYEWKTVKEAIDWTNKCGLKIIEGFQIYVNPEVDLFSEQHNFNYSSYLMLCKKEEQFESHCQIKKEGI